MINNTNIDKMHIRCFSWLVALYFFIAPFEDMLNFGFGTLLKYIALLLALLLLLHLLTGIISINVNDPLIIFSCLLILLTWSSVMWSYNLEATLSQNKTYTLLIMFFMINRLYKFNDKEIILIKKVVLLSLIFLIFYCIANYKEILFNNYSRFVLNDKNDPNNLAAHLIMPYFVLIIFFINNKGISRILSMIALICASFIFMLIGSRGALIAVFLGISYIVFYTYNKTNKSNLIFFIVLVFIIYNFILNYLPGDLIRRLFTVDSYIGDIGVYDSRSGIWKNIITYVVPNMPLWGYGAGVPGYILIDFYGYIKGVHNTYLNIILEYGIIGITFFILFIYYIYSNIKKNGEILCNAILISMLVIIFFLDSFEKKYFWNAMMFITIISNRCQKSNINKIL